LVRNAAPDAVNPHYSDASAGFLARQRARKRKVYVWTVNDPLEMRRLAQETVAGIITDNPPAALRAVREN
jgi:glycerophosphoryl diester phosphodiesterase